jgi:hypothetical protein
MRDEMNLMCEIPQRLYGAPCGMNEKSRAWPDTAGIGSPVEPPTTLLAWSKIDISGKAICT